SAKASDKADRPLDGCILPNFDPWDKDILPFVELDYDPLKNCHRKFKPLTKLRKGNLTIDVDDNNDNITCWGRNLPQTVQFLEKAMQAVSFPYLNRIGLNSRPNGVAMWFGKRMERVDRSLFGLPSLEVDWTYESFCYRYLDNETTLFKEFSNKGYKTLLAEDWMKGTLNWPDCWGFRNQPTDHYMRPFQVALEKNASKVLENTYSPANCIEQHRDVLRYLQDFIHSYKDHPKFGWIWLSLLSHSRESGTIHADSDFQRFLLDNKEKIARTKLGNLEENNPMFLMTVPKSLREGTDILSILRENAARLQTPYDIRATFLDIIK
ncbi:hypothetical protein TELCIR_11720, partial [Teladorsagia circumcincta]